VTISSSLKPIYILLVEDSPTDILMTREAFVDVGMLADLTVAEDGVEAMSLLRGENAQLPDLILLDLNLPRKNGREVLAELKSDPDLRSIPVVVLTTSRAEDDVAIAYNLHANCYVIKPVDFINFSSALGEILNFWFSVATLRPRLSHA
jgi:CheY-like chemotaxis protein